MQHSAKGGGATTSLPDVRTFSTEQGAQFTEKHIEVGP
jgi:hypothetical protein